MTAARVVDAEVLLRRFEPVVRLTSGELFLPSAIDGYLEHTALIRGSGDAARVLAEPGSLTPARLASLGRQHCAEPLSLRYVEQPMGRQQYRAWRRNGTAPPFNASSGAASAGLLARVVAALMRLSLLLRGKVPGGWTAAAYEQSRAAKDAGTCHYYGHVVRDAGYAALEYWFFYPMNDWRSSFRGVNDHEADWEHVTVMLAEQDGSFRPAWVVFASHNETGADLRRRWDDPDLEHVGEHPVVYVGAGSHSAACTPGEYLVTVAPAMPGWLQRIRAKVARILPWWDPESTGIGIPFIDYRRGDGLSIGPGQDRPWHPHVIGNDTDWVRDYRGLWGLDTGDPLGGERAPAGPRYERDGQVRQSWAQPVGWAELDAEPATEHEVESLRRERPDSLKARLVTVGEELELLRDQLRGATVADRLAGRSPKQPSAQTQELNAKVAELRRRQAMLRAELDAEEARQDMTMPEVAPQSHLSHRATPLSEDKLARSRALRVWASASSAILFLALGVLLLAGGTQLLGAVGAVVVGMLLIEAALRRHLVALLVNVTVAAVVVIGVVAVGRLLLDNLRIGVGVLLLLAAAYMGVQTVADALLHRAGRDRDAGRQ